MGEIKTTKGWIRSIGYSVSDIEPLIDWSIENKASGPLFLTTLAGISLMSGICYGRPVDEEKFIRFALDDMGIERVFADALYKSWTFYHTEGTWADGVWISEQDRFNMFQGSSVGKSIGINVVKLAQLYLSTVAGMNIIEGE